MNRLASALSPYLRSHADNPVDWYPWGEEAFAAARERDVPVLVSIGYATCHWCHVMARESFSDPAVAAYLNEHFVAIKVDREEHPDVDASYLAAASAFTKQLGWPLTALTTPEGRTFYAGTYFPPRAVQGVPAFMDVLIAVTDAWRERRAELDDTAAHVAEALAAASVAETRGDLPGAAELAAAAALLAADEERVHGGFGGAPKFPVAPVLAFLSEPGPVASGAVASGPVASGAVESGTVASGAVAPDTGGRALAVRTLLAMGASPLRDPVEGGFFRYATRADWSEPHYERMLTDNALLLRVLAELITGPDAAGPGSRDELERLAAGVAAFLRGVLQLPSGGFASAQDSESLVDGARSEGGYYALTKAERMSQPPPALDDKVLAGWNGLAIGALARFGAVVGGAEGAADLAAARRAADHVLGLHLGADGTLARASLGGEVSAAVATLEDLGMLAGGLLELALATGEVSYAVTARTLLDAALDPSGGFTPPGGADPVLAARGLALPDDPAEGATPSGLTACADAAWRLFALGAGDRYRDAAARAMQQVAGIAVTRPIAFGGSLAVMARLAAPLVQLVTVVPDGSPDAPGGAPAPGEPAPTPGEPAHAHALVDETRRHAASVTAVVTDAQAAAFADAGFELFEGRGSIDGDPAAYRCESFVCALPVRDAAALAALAD
ncbi:thioredoxin domain-containing protein [Agromyces sp. NPDC058110]|uniref:thioredoxin domain-containing protein n=1 Tax=Agromyces sp. NPDC058110 TaxID=3346345 RepID=UPI0036DA46A1